MCINTTDDQKPDEPKISKRLCNCETKVNETSHKKDRL